MIFCAIANMGSFFASLTCFSPRSSKIYTLSPTQWLAHCFNFPACWMQLWLQFIKLTEKIKNKTSQFLFFLDRMFPPLFEFLISTVATWLSHWLLIQLNQSASKWIKGRMNGRKDLKRASMGVELTCNLLLEFYLAKREREVNLIKFIFRACFYFHFLLPRRIL